MTKMTKIVLVGSTLSITVAMQKACATVGIAVVRATEDIDTFASKMRACSSSDDTLAKLYEAKLYEAIADVPPVNEDTLFPMYSEYIILPIPIGIGGLITKRRSRALHSLWPPLDVRKGRYPQIIILTKNKI